VGSEAGKVTGSLASHWPCVTYPYGLRVLGEGDEHTILWTVAFTLVAIHNRIVEMGLTFLPRHYHTTRVTITIHSSLLSGHLWSVHELTLFRQRENVDDDGGECI